MAQCLLGRFHNVLWDRNDLPRDLWKLGVTFVVCNFLQPIMPSISHKFSCLFFKSCKPVQPSLVSTIFDHSMEPAQCCTIFMNIADIVQTILQYFQTHRKNRNSGKHDYFFKDRLLKRHSKEQFKVIGGVRGAAAAGRELLLGQGNEH